MFRRLFVCCWNENELRRKWDKRGENRRKGSGGGQVEGEGFGGQTDKQTTHRFPAALCHSRETPSPRSIRLHSSPLMLKTLLRRGNAPPPGWLIPSSGRLSGTSLRDGASQVTLPGIISSNPGLHTGMRKLLKTAKMGQISTSTRVT